MIYIGAFIIGCLFIKNNRLKQERDRYYNNYHQCLLALSETDPTLKDYLEKEGIRE